MKCSRRRWRHSKRSLRSINAKDDEAPAERWKWKQTNVHVTNDVYFIFALKLIQLFVIMLIVRFVFLTRTREMSLGRAQAPAGGREKSGKRGPAAEAEIWGMYEEMKTVNLWIFSTSIYFSRSTRRPRALSLFSSSCHCVNFNGRSCLVSKHFCGNANQTYQRGLHDDSFSSSPCFFFRSPFPFAARPGLGPSREAGAEKNGAKVHKKHFEFHLRSLFRFYCNLFSMSPPLPRARSNSSVFIFSRKFIFIMIPFPVLMVGKHKFLFHFIQHWLFFLADCSHFPQLCVSVAGAKP